MKSFLCVLGIVSAVIFGSQAFTATRSTCSELQNGIAQRGSLVSTNGIRVYSDDSVNSGEVACGGYWKVMTINDVYGDRCDLGWTCRSVTPVVRVEPRGWDNSWDTGYQLRSPRAYSRDSRSDVKNRTALPGTTYVPGGYLSSNGVFHGGD